MTHEHADDPIVLASTQHDVERRRALLGSFEPAIHLNYMTLDHWRGKNLADIGEEMSRLHKDLKAVTGYFWDNEHFVICDIYGRPALTVQVHAHQPCLHLWEIRHGTHIGDYDGIPDDARLILEEASKGHVRCSECRKWVEEFKHFSFAGAVCLSCYDPAKHKPPDTRGD